MAVLLVAPMYSTRPSDIRRPGPISLSPSNMATGTAASLTQAFPVPAVPAVVVAIVTVGEVPTKLPYEAVIRFCAA